MKIKKALPADIPLIAPLFDAYRQFYEQPSDLGLATRHLSARLGNSETHLFYADQDGVAMGFVHLFPSFSSVYATRTLILNDLYVAPAFRRKGAGRALMQAAAEFSRESGSRGLRLETQEGNAVARRLYKDLGYHQESGFVHYFLNTPGK